jgi:hypothetical protein
MFKTAVSKEQAEQVVQAIKENWPMYVVDFSGDGPTLYPHDHEELPEGCWSIAWEGGPEDWSWRASMEVRVSGVFLEPIASWCLGVFPKDDR